MQFRTELFSYHLKKYCLNNALSLHKAATLFGCSAPTISKLKNGYPPDVFTLTNFCTISHLPLSTFIN